MKVNTRTTCTTIGAYTNVSRIPDHIYECLDTEINTEINSLYRNYLDLTNSIWTDYYSDIIFLTNHISKLKSQKAQLSIKTYAYKHAILDVIWQKLSDTISADSSEPSSRLQEYTIVGAKNHFKGIIGHIKNKRYNTQAAGFKHAIHIKVRIAGKYSHIINIMFYVGSGSCNITGTKLYEEAKDGMILLINLLSPILDMKDVPCFFIKPHMNKLRIIMGIDDDVIDPEMLTLDKTRKRINYASLKSFIENDNASNDYRVVRIDNMACIRMNIIKAHELFDVYFLDNEWYSKKMNLLDINNDLFSIKASKLSKELERLIEGKCIEYEVKICIELVSGKISICGKHFDLALDVRDELLDIFNNRSELFID